MRLVLLLLAACASESSTDRRELGRAALAEAYARQLCPALSDGGEP